MLKAISKLISPRIIGVLILVWLFSTIDLRAMIMILKSSSLDFVLLGLFLLFVHFTIKIIRYQLILLRQRVETPFIKTLQYAYAANYLSLVTPGRAGEAAKAYFIHKATGAPLNKLLAGILVDRGLDVYLLLLTAGIGVISLDAFDFHRTPIILCMVVLALSPLLLLINPLRRAIIKVVDLLQKPLKGYLWISHLKNFYSELRFLLSFKTSLSFLLTVVAYIFFFGSCYYLAVSLGIQLSFRKITFFIAIANILSFLPISVAGIGTRDACLAFLFAQESLPYELAIAFSILILFTYVVFGIAGFLALVLIKSNTKIPGSA